MFKILTYNQFHELGWTDCQTSAMKLDRKSTTRMLFCCVLSTARPADPESLKAVGRAGAGVNNIPVADYSKRGIPVFNAPGANSNAVAELAIAGMLLASRNIPAALNFIHGLEGNEESINSTKSRRTRNISRASRYPGKTLGVLGLGAIGVKVRPIPQPTLGLKYHRLRSVYVAWRVPWKLNASTVPATSIDDLVSRADFISLHIPLNDKTKNLFSKDHIERIKRRLDIAQLFPCGCRGWSRSVLAALDSGALHAHVCDFPTPASDKPSACYRAASSGRLHGRSRRQLRRHGG